MPLPFSYSDCSRKQFVTFHYVYSCNTAAIPREDAIHVLTSSISIWSVGVGAPRVEFQQNTVPAPSYQRLVFTSQEKYLDKKELESDSVYVSN